MDELREIKFRGQTEFKNEFVYGSLDLTDIPRVYILRDGRRADLVKPRTVGQFMGRYDDDFVEIYEGDIVEVYGNRILSTDVHGLYEVVWQDTQFVLRKTMNGAMEYAHLIAGDRVKVVGNIHTQY